MADEMKDWRVFVIEYRGMGISSYNTPITCHDDLVDDIKDFVDRMNLSEFALLGWSTGGMAGIWFRGSYAHMALTLGVLQAPLPCYSPPSTQGW